MPSCGVPADVKDAWGYVCARVDDDEGPEKLWGHPYAPASGAMQLCTRGLVSELLRSNERPAAGILKTSPVGGRLPVTEDEEGGGMSKLWWCASLQT